MLTDRQKEVADRQRWDASTMFPDLRSSPVYKRVQRDDVFDIPKSPGDRAITPTLDVPSDGLADNLPNSSSPMRSSPIDAALSRRSTPKKPSELALFDEHEDVPSSPPRQSIEKDEEPTQEVDMQEIVDGMAGVEDGNSIVAKNAEEFIVNATITPSRLAEINSNHDDGLAQARQCFEGISSLSTGTDMIMGTDDRDDEEQEPAVGENVSIDDIKNGKLEPLQVLRAEYMKSSSPAPSTSGFLADAQLKAEFEASTQQSREQDLVEPAPRMTPSGLPASGSSIVSDSFNAVVPATNSITKQDMAESSLGQESTSSRAYDSNRPAASMGPSREPFFERFSSFSDQSKKMFDDCRAMFDAMSKEQCEHVEEELEKMEDELRSVIKEARKAGKSKSK